MSRRDSHRPASIGRKAVSLVALGSLAIAVAACSSAKSAKTSASPGAPASSSTTPTPTGPATATLKLTGSTGIAGALKVGSIACGLPGVGGSSIFLLAQPANKQVTVRLILTAGTVSVGVVSGSGKNYRSRTFTGTGMTGFDPATRAQLDSKLTEVADPSSPGTLGVAASIVGTVDCGNQAPGSTTLSVTGPTVAGVLTGGPLSPAKVTCTKLKNGFGVQTVAVAHAGTEPVLLIIFVQAGKFTVAVAPKSGNSEFFPTSTGTATATSAAAHIDGAVTSGDKPVKVLHVTGDSTCGNPVTG